MVVRLANSIILLFIATLIASDALFVRPSATVIPYPFRLSLADRFGIPYKGIAYDAGKAASLPGFALSLNAELGTLDESTFSILQKTYSAWSDTKSRVKWNEGGQYTSLDYHLFCRQCPDCIFAHRAPNNVASHRSSVRIN